MTNTKYRPSTKTRLAKLMRAKEGTDHFEFVWEYLEEDQEIRDWQNGASSDEEVLERADLALRRYHRARRSQASGARTKPTEGPVWHIPVEITGREKAMTEAFREYLAMHANGRVVVQRYRREHLPGGGLLKDDEEISAFLAEELEIETSVAEYIDSHGPKPAREMPFGLSAEPPVGNTANFMSDEELAREIAEYEKDTEQRIEANWHNPPGPRLEKLAEWLAEVYPWESVGDAVVFLVSGRPPRLAPTLSATSDVYRATYSITFLPWVFEETVVQAYRATRRTLRDGQPSNKELPNDKTVRVFRFVTEQADDSGQRPSWATLFDRWNAVNPKEQYAERSAFRKAYNRAVKALVPPYRPYT
jgi:hypothetical protein